MKKIHTRYIVAVSEAEQVAKTAIRDCGIEADSVTVTQHGAVPGKSGEYADNHIHVYGDLCLQTILHEAAHHIHEKRLGYAPKRAHGIGFHRICFEIRNNFRNLYGIDIAGINGYNHTNSFRNALSEWFNATAAETV